MFTEEEVLEGLKDCNKEKAPGPDGFPMGFLQDFWPVIKKNVMKLFEDFHRTGKFLKSINSTFIVIIPKVSGAIRIKEFRHISLVWKCV